VDAAVPVTFPVLNHQHHLCSRAGSWWALRAVPESGRIELHNARLRFGADHLWTVQVHRDGCALTGAVTMGSGVLEMTGTDWSVQMTLDGTDALHLASAGCTVLITSPRHFSYGIVESAGRHTVISSQSHLATHLDVTTGDATLDGPSETLPWGGTRNQHSVLTLRGSRCAVRLITTPWELSRDRAVPTAGEAEAAALATAQTWAAVRAALPPGPSHRHALRERCWHSLWAMEVPAAGAFATPLAVMSKQFMGGMWSWDHCFTSLALAGARPERALDEFLAPFPHQAPTGQLPDTFAADGSVVWGVTKPPIHGWAFAKLWDRQAFDHATLARILDHLSRWSDWYRTCRDRRGDGIISVPMGCDSFDNSTLFDAAFYLGSPDLTAYLVLQLQCQARLARHLGRSADALRWDSQAQAHLAALLGLWDGTRFTGRRPDGSAADAPHCAINLMPLILGPQLPEAIRVALIADLRQRLTPHGLPSEAVTSPHYQDDLYCRGSIWAPQNLFAVDGLLACGERALAIDLARRFLATLEQSGFYECFDARTGAGQRVPDYTWTAAAGILLTDWLPEA
jgi:hypothetical protein